MNSGQEMAKKFICQILGNSFKIDKEVLFVDNVKKTDLSKAKYLVLNGDELADRPRREGLSTLTFGFQQGADFQVSDLRQNGCGYLNFKINHKGSIVPFWLEKYSGKEQIYAALTAIAVGTIFGLNLVEISQALKRNVE